MAAQEEPCSAQWALDLLEPTPFDESNFIGKYFMVPAMAYGCVKGVQWYNLFYRMPKYAQAPLMLVTAVGGGFVGYCIHKIKNIGYARLDAVLRDYIRRHPERFPKPENRKYAGLFIPWRPVGR